MCYLLLARCTCVYERRVGATLIWLGLCPPMGSSPDQLWTSRKEEGGQCVFMGCFREWLAVSVLILASKFK